MKEREVSAGSVVVSRGHAYLHVILNYSMLGMICMLALIAIATYLDEAMQ